MRILFVAFLMAVSALAAKSQGIAKLKITDIEKFTNSKTDEVLVLNFWATFCKPCVAEIPSFIKISNQYKVKLLLVSLDLPSYYPEKVASFAKKHQFNTNIVWLNETNADYFCPKIDKSWSGSIPATLMINTKTGYRKFFEEELDAATFEMELKKAMGQESGVNSQESKVIRALVNNQ